MPRKKLLYIALFVFSLLILLIIIFTYKAKASFEAVLLRQVEPAQGLTSQGITLPAETAQQQPPAPFTVKPKMNSAITFISPQPKKEAVSSGEFSTPVNIPVSVSKIPVTPPEAQSSVPAGATKASVTQKKAASAPEENAEAGVTKLKKFPTERENNEMNSQGVIIY